jgi:hypothetical protein
MTTTDTAPTLTPALIGAIRSFQTSASTPGMGLELLWSRWIDIRQACAANSPDPCDVTWSRVLDLVTEYRARRDSTPFNVLTVIAEAKR